MPLPFKSAGRPPHWPFHINRRSKQAEGLVYWNPCIPWGSFSPGFRLDNVAPRCDWTSVSWVGTTFGNAVPEFNASSSYGLIADHPMFDLSDDFGVCFWVRTSNVAQANGHMLSKYINADREWIFSIDASYLQTFTSTTGSNFLTWRQSGAQVLANNTWHHVAFFYDNRPFFYIDGASVPNSGSGAGALNNGAADVIVGGIDDTTPSPRFLGSIFDVRFYSGRTGSEVSAALYDPSTRWELYAPTIREQLYDFLAEPPAAAFNPAWARGSNVVLGSGSAA